MAKAIEDGFPITAISQLAERESWRKEIYRPIYYVHKWWARRLGSVFRAIVLSSCVDEEQDVASLFYQSVNFPDVVVFDPFMGSGTTVGEAIKLGCRAIGRDINPVAVGLVTTALQDYTRDDVLRAYRDLEASVAQQILSFYKTDLATGGQGDVLYHFWVKTVPCPRCDYNTELFKSRIFAKHAYAKKHPGAKAVCPQCGSVNEVRYDDEMTTCWSCESTYELQQGPVAGVKVTCPSCRLDFRVIDAVRRTGLPPSHRMYAKMVLTTRGQKVYLPTDEGDRESYRRAEEMLSDLWEFIPRAEIKPGYNTNQVLNYNYRYWHQMFNARQLVTIALLVREIRQIGDSTLRMLFAFLLSGTLEFNNMFCSFKGEGTGAVRHMFSHHILKPELVPLEANLWGTPKSSGSFSTLFRSRILRALDYKAAPFELRLTRSDGAIRSDKVFGLSDPIGEPIAGNYQEFCQGKSVYLSCGDASETDLPDGSVDLVITDPPFFDNVHYSQLADFFHVWLRLMLDEHHYSHDTSTRSPHEVQDTDAGDFSSKLASVLRECYRVLKDSGLLALTYHHSRIEGWTSVYKAVREAGFQITHTQPVKAEMAVSVPIQQSKSPVHFDLILVCRKIPSAIVTADEDPQRAEGSALKEAKGHEGIPMLACLGETKTAAQELQQGGIKVSLGDIKVILMGSILSRLATLGDLSREIATISELEEEVDALARQIQAETDSPASLSPIDHLQRVGDLNLPKSAPIPQQLRFLLDALKLGYLEDGAWHVGGSLEDEPEGKTQPPTAQVEYHT
jgi:hypothetical protein